ncbi:chorismate synthase [Campylobacter ureolyticus]|uniref:chorismate synthase n=1 Tax=Campylobacter ureolyticus TaxID=827 RepID=UPI002907B208|nr:chorismate synthase [Campylobacter ureolyticus]MDU5326342.1 chorismate synthase [Campylobacter ureolyticus]
MNTFGVKLRLTTFGESHGIAIGGILDGFPAGVKINFDFLQNELDKRKPGSKFATKRKESDKVGILSGVFEGLSTGTPIGFIIKNEDQKSKDYGNLKDIFRPGHADYTYFYKYGIRDYRGGGRSSARESAIRVAGGAFCQMLLNEFKISVESGVFSVGEVNFNADFNEEFKSEILKAKNSHNSVGASVITIIKNSPIGLGEVLYDKFDARLAAAMMGINAVKAVEIGNGIKSAKIYGDENNDKISKNGFLTNNSGGILGGITNGDDILIKSYFKPTPSIFLEQNTINLSGKDEICKLKGRHDPCVGTRGSVVATAMARLVTADMLLLNTSSNLQNLKKIYG